MLKKLFFFSIPAILVAVFFYYGNDSQSRKYVQTKPFVPDQTDVMNYSFPFLSHDVEIFHLDIGPIYLLGQILPDVVINLVSTLIPGFSFSGNFSNVMHKINILDARKIPDLSFDDTGFALIDVGKSETKDWRDQDDIKKFNKEMEPHIRKLYPDVKEIIWTFNVVRGGNKFGDQPAAIDGPHLDFHQNDTARAEFHSRRPLNPYDKGVPDYLLDKNHTYSKYEPKVVLGVWKPIYMDTSVCDHPLAVMDGRTFYPSEETLYELSINIIFFVIYNLNAAIKYHVDQSWYYYSFQTNEEVLFFTQYTRGNFLANPHASFNNPNCPEELDSRISIETRAVLFFEESDSKPSSESRITG